MRVKQAPQRKIDPDVVYNSVKIQKLINQIMVAGKKSIAQRLVYQAMEQIKKETKQDPLEVFEQALDNITPKMEVRSRRVGGAAYQVPTPVRGKRAASLAIRWLVAESNRRSNSEYHTFAEKLAAELIDAYNNQGGSIQRKLTTHKMAEANKAFAHFRW
jgi:small subunit ribosomal protein S7